MKSEFKKIIPEFVVSVYHWLWALVGVLFYGFPSSHIKVIGVTGTNGKSTVVSLIKNILEEAGFKVASISSIEFQIGAEGKANEMKMTMPGRGYLQKFLRKAVRADCDYVIMEVTSEGIKQHRHQFIKFDGAVFTNLSPEHIESHGSFEKYRKAKGKLWKKLAKGGTSVINLDNKYKNYFLKFEVGEKYGYTTQRAELKGGKTIEAKQIELEDDFSRFKIKDREFKLPLMGEFNVSNSLAAISVALSQGVSLRTCKRALESVEGIPGRMETVAKEPFRVVVDYAHTPASLQKVYRDLAGSETMICVLGSCGGGRDRWKRPKLGKIADEYCDKIILTNEDPYDEDPMRIVKEIKKGIDDSEVDITLNRKQAIKQALDSAAEGDLVVITGKGSEPWMCVANGKKIPWDDREEVRKQLESN